MKAELMRYRNDSLSFFMNIIGLSLDACFLMMIYSSRGVPANDRFGSVIGIDILFNIVFLLAAFLTAEKVKTYSLNWCWVSLALGILQVPRILLPISLHNAGQYLGFPFVCSIIVLLSSAAAFFYGCYTSFSKSRKLAAFIKENNLEGK